jgi:hypothetical protein
LLLVRLLSIIISLLVLLVYTEVLVRHVRLLALVSEISDARVSAGRLSILNRFRVRSVVQYRLGVRPGLVRWN